MTERAGAGEVTAREQIVEARVRPNVIRRRTQRVEEVVKPEAARPAAPASDFTDDAAMLDLPEFDSGDGGLFEGDLGVGTSSFDDGDFGAPDHWNPAAKLSLFRRSAWVSRSKV